MSKCYLSPNKLSLKKQPIKRLSLKKLALQRPSLQQKFFVALFILLISIAANSSTILVLGDSLSAAYGIDEKKGWVNLLQQRLNGKYTLVNGSISGDTTAGGLSRLPALLEKHQPHYVLIELGGNDGLRGYSIHQMKSNLQQIIDISRAGQAVPLILGIQIPPNYGQRYAEAFAAAFPQVAKTHDVQFIPFVSDDLLGQPSLLQADGIHPTEQAQTLIAEKMHKALAAILDL